MISQTLLVAFEDFDHLDAARAAAALGRGLRAGGAARGPGRTRGDKTGTLQVDLCPIELPPDSHAPPDGRTARNRRAGDPAAHTPRSPRAHDTAAFAAQLAALDFDARMRAARAVIVGAARLDEATLLGSATFEIATRARQAGVPAYAVTAHHALSRFDARILDLQVVLRARDARGLRRAGERLAQMV